MVVSAFLYLYLLYFHLIYCRNTVIFLKPGVSHTKSVIIFHGASAILQTVELKLKMMIRFCSAGFSPVILNYFSTTLCMVLISSFSTVQAGVGLITDSREAEFLCVVQHQGLVKRP